MVKTPIPATLRDDRRPAPLRAQNTNSDRYIKAALGDHGGGSPGEHLDNLESGGDRRFYSAPEGKPTGAAARGEAALENNANSSSAPSSRERRMRRFMRRAALWKVSENRRLQKCGRTLYGDSATMRLSSDGIGGYAGVTTCGSVWACPCCSAKILARRQTEVQRAVSSWTANGGRLAMLTLTMQHSQNDGLSGLWGSLSAAWGSVTSGRRWVEERLLYGVEGYLRVVEVTHGENGWHVHVHALLFLLPGHCETELLFDDWKTSITDRWSASLVRGGRRPARGLAQDLHLVKDPSDALTGYFTKSVDNGRAIALEFTQSAGKKSRQATGGQTPWGLLDELVLTGDADALDLWLEWEDASAGKRQMTWSRGIRDQLDVGEEIDDETIADEELGDSSDDVVEIPSAGWKRLCTLPHVMAAALDVLEAHGAAGAVSLLHSLGVEAHLLSDRPPG